MEDNTLSLTRGPSRSHTERRHERNTSVGSRLKPTRRDSRGAAGAAVQSCCAPPEFIQSVWREQPLADGHRVVLVTATTQRQALLV